MGRHWGWKSGWKKGGWQKKHKQDRDENDWGSGKYDWKSWLDRHEEKREKYCQPEKEWGHCRNHDKGHGNHDHWNNGHWRHECNQAPEIIAPQTGNVAGGNSGVVNAVLTVFALDPDGDTLEYSLVPENDGESTDAEFFSMDPVTGELIMDVQITPFGDADGDGTYEVTVEVTDGRETVSMDLDIMFTFGG